MTTEEKTKVLVIDDDETVLVQVEKILSDHDYTPICARSGKSGIEKAQSENPALIILDRRMPEMDGNETLTQLKAHETTHDIPVIMLTGDNAIADVSKSFELGALDYIVKPFDQDNFLIRLKKALKT